MRPGRGSCSCRPTSCSTANGPLPRGRRDPGVGVRPNEGGRRGRGAGIAGHVVVRVSLLFGPTLDGRANFFERQVGGLRCRSTGATVPTTSGEPRWPCPRPPTALVEIADSGGRRPIARRRPGADEPGRDGPAAGRRPRRATAAIEPVSRRSAAGEPRPRDTSLDSERWRCDSHRSRGRRSKRLSRKWELVREPRPLARAPGPGSLRPLIGPHQLGLLQDVAAHLAFQLRLRRPLPRSGSTASRANSLKKYRCRPIGGARAAVADVFGQSFVPSLAAGRQLVGLDAGRQRAIRRAAGCTGPSGPRSAWGRSGPGRPGRPRSGPGTWPRAARRSRPAAATRRRRRRCTGPGSARRVRTPTRSGEEPWGSSSVGRRSSYHGRPAGETTIRLADGCGRRGGTVDSVSWPWTGPFPEFPFASTRRLSLRSWPARTWWPSRPHDRHRRPPSPSATRGPRLEVKAGSFATSAVGPGKSYAITVSAKESLTLESRAASVGPRQVTAVVRLRTDVAPNASAQIAVGRADGKDRPARVPVDDARFRGGVVHRDPRRQAAPRPGGPEQTDGLGAAERERVHLPPAGLPVQGHPARLAGGLPGPRSRPTWRRLPTSPTSGCRCGSRCGRARSGVWLDDRLVAWKAAPDLKVDGADQIVLSPGVQLAGFSVASAARDAGLRAGPDRRLRERPRVRRRRRREAGRAARTARRSRSAACRS